MRYDIETFPYEKFAAVPFLTRKRGNQGVKAENRKVYRDIVTAFDIETTRLEDVEQSIMYIWQWHFYGIGTVFGRTWEEFNEFCTHIRDISDIWLVVYVHNLSFEFQFLSGIYPFEPEEVFAVKSRKVLKCDMMGVFEFRCSYLHSNMSLDEYTKKMKVAHQKLSGEEFDYSKKRFPWTPLTDREYEYVENDVIGLCEALIAEMEIDGDNLYTIPLTSTGYVRRDAKRAMRSVSKRFVKDQLPDYFIYQMCREAFRGGNTHANRYYVGNAISDVHSADRSSSYPDVQCNCEFPISSFHHAGALPLDEVLKLIYKRHRAVILRVSMTNVSLKRREWGCPYLSRDKCRRIENGLFDNGRILSADYLETTITDIDLKIILEEYIFDDLVPFDVCHARYGKLPKALVAETIAYYVTKTQKKNVEGEEVQYLKSKNKLNSIYGMMAQDPVKQDIRYEFGEFREQEELPENLLEKSNAKAFLCYQWGCWVTAWARYRLEEGIRLAHDDGAEFIYCDTDSVKYIGEIKWDKYNEERIKDSLKSGAYATDPNGEVHYMGVYEQEKDMEEFKTLGAKKYCFREKDGKLQVTIAGVSKKKGGAELEQHGGLSAFRVGFKFVDAGGLEAVYNDVPEIKSYTADGRTIPITKNVVLRPSTYTLGLAADYARLLENITFEILE